MLNKAAKNRWIILLAGILIGMSACPALVNIVTERFKSCGEIGKVNKVLQGANEILLQRIESITKDRNGYKK